MTTSPPRTGLIEINTNAIVQNYHTLCAHVPHSTCAAVLKADAYGFGTEHIAPLLFAQGCRHFFVAHIEEGLFLRSLLPEPTIYVLSGILPGTEALCVKYHLTPILTDFGMVERWAAEARARECKLPCGLHMDTGMNRSGFDAQDTAKLFNNLNVLEPLSLEVVMSHLASSADSGDPMNAQQKALFDQFRSAFPGTKASLADTGGVYLPPAFHYDIVRTGKGLFGLYSPPEGASPLRPCLKLLGRILQVRTAAKGESVGYGASHILTRDSKLATLGIGFADGYDRRLSNVASVMIGGHHAPVVGRISMDYTVVDVTDIPEPIGEWAECVNDTITLDTLAHMAGTISREFSTGFKGLKRVYV